LDDTVAAGWTGRTRYWVRRLLLPAAALGLAGVMVATTVALIAYRKLDGNITSDNRTEAMLGRDAAGRPKLSDKASDGPHTAQNILLIGSDDRGGTNRKYGRDEGSQRSDTTILLHLAADRKSATAVSIPRDLMTRLPACERTEGGGRTTPQWAQFNWAFQFGGAACTIRTVETMTGIRVDHHMIVDFSGFKRMVNAVGGVEICLAEDVQDKDAKLDLPAGRQTVTGEEALAYVRARKKFDDGSDTSRMGRQQQFLGSLVRKVNTSGVLLNPARLYPLLDAATSSLTVDPGLDSLSELTGLARSLRGIPERNVVFLTAPRKPYPMNINRDVLRQPLADRLFAALRDDIRVRVAGKKARKSMSADSGGIEHDGTGLVLDPRFGGSKPGSGTDEDDFFTGRTADSDICD
jgi:LCP family protein required for cell wall assembly